MRRALLQQAPLSSCCGLVVVGCCGLPTDVDATTAIASSSNSVMCRSHTSSSLTCRRPTCRVGWVRAGANPLEFASVLNRSGTRCHATSTAAAAADTPPEASPADPHEGAVDAAEFALRDKYGEGNLVFFRALYKDLISEMSCEGATKPPPPLVASSTTVTSAAPPASSSSWHVRYDSTTNMMVFDKKGGDTRSNGEAHGDAEDGRVRIYAPVKMGNPPKMHQGLYMVDFFVLEALIYRNGVVLHYSLCVLESSLHVRNVRAYRRDVLATNGETPPPLEDVMDISMDANWRRHHLFYDGPCMYHLELGLQNELYDIMMDYGVTPDVAQWAAQWVSYVEHREFVRWSLGCMNHCISAERRGPEQDFVTEEEVERLANPPEEWLASHYK